VVPAGEAVRKASFDVILGPSLEQRPGDLASLVTMILGDRLKAARVDVQPDGDVRYWGVDATQSAVLQGLENFGNACFVNTTGKPPAYSFVMVNRTDAHQCPKGSGGGWHRDSFRRQYKAFTYLTDVERESQGAFCFIPASNAFPVRLASLCHRLVSGGHRYRDGTIDSCVSAGLTRRAVLLKSGVPFFVDSSLIHRGLPISEGHRIMAAVYMFEDVPATFDSLRRP
jgi:hypothetical protein